MGSPSMQEGPAPLGSDLPAFPTDLELAERLAVFAAGAGLPPDHVVWQTVFRLRRLVRVGGV